jgi:ribosomal protein S18 acetylase RimI-like enzyme
MLDAGHELNIRPWREEDFEKVRLIFWETWMATYSGYIPASDLRDYLDAHYSLKALHEMFVGSDAYGFVADVDETLAGCARCTHARSEARFYLTSLYVLPRFQQRGIGARLLNEAERQASACGYDRVWLGVMQKNTIAFEWYKRIGFTFVEEAPFIMGATTVSHAIGFRTISSKVTQDHLSHDLHKE